MDEPADSTGLSPQRMEPKSGTSDLDSPSKARDDTCCICLGTISNACVAETCQHRFCLECLKQWSKVKNNCPLCKSKLENILYDIKSDTDYKQYVVPKKVVSEELSPFHRFVILPEGPELEFRRGVHSVGNRARMYREDLWVQYPMVGGERVRLCNPAYYREHEGATHRLIPWLTRELRALECPGRFIVVIIDLLSRYEIMSRGFRSTVHKFFTHHTKHFQHEFNCFAHSVYDMIGWDNVTQNRYGSYQTRLGPPYFLSIDDEDEDVIALNSIEIDLTREPSQSEDTSASSSNTNTEGARIPHPEMTSSNSSSTENSNTDIPLPLASSRAPVVISSESDSVLYYAPEPVPNKKKRKKSISKRNEDSTSRLNQEIENIVISSGEDVVEEPVSHVRKRTKSKHSHQAGSSAHNSRSKERKDHPSKIKSSNKYKFNFMKSSKS